MSEFFVIHSKYLIQNSIIENMEKRLFRIKNKDTKLGGVALGLSEYFDLDVTLVRVLFVILFFVPHLPSFILYFILWAVLPVKNEYGYANVDDTSTENSNPLNLNFSNMSNQSKQSSITGGVILIILGSIFAIKEFFDVNIFHFVGKLWPLFLVGLGVWLIVRDRPDSNSNL